MSAVGASGTGSLLGASLTDLLLADEIVPGADPSYQICKLIYMYHPLGAKMAESPITMAQSQMRDISIAKGPEDMLKEAFQKEWDRFGANGHIKNAKALARVYGISTLAVGVKGQSPSEPLKLDDIWDKEVYVSVFDPLNTAGSLVLNQNPNDADFLKTDTASVQGTQYHRSRIVITMNEKPVYLGYTNAAFGYVGRSVYQRALFPLKSFVQSMRTDDLVMRKAGVIVAKLKSPGSIANRMMTTLFGQKRSLLKEAEFNDVISVGDTDAVESLNFQNLDAPMALARKNILENIAVAADMPAKLLNQETFAEGFGEGTEDAKAVERYIVSFREEMQPLYDFMDEIIRRRAWNPDFYKTVQEKFPAEYGKKEYQTAFYEWSNSFTATWPNLRSEPDSEKVKVDKEKFEAISSLLEILKPDMDPDNKATLIQWAVDNFNDQKLLFSSPLELDYEALAEYTPPEMQMGADQEFCPPRPKVDSVVNLKRKRS